MQKIIYSFLFFIFLVFPSFADTLHFVQIADVHYPKKNFLYYGNRDLSNAVDNYTKAINYINSQNNIEFVFYTGDYVDRSLKEVYDDFFALTKKINKPYYFCLGNHEVNTPFGLNKMEAVDYTRQMTSSYSSGANYFVNLNENFIAVMLDGTHDEKICARGNYKKNTLKWLEKVLVDNIDKNVLIFQHFPIIEPAEDKFYIHSHKTRNKKSYFKLLKKYPNVKIIVSGHFHKKGEFEKDNVLHFSTPALFEKPAYIRYFEIDYDGKSINSIKSRLIKL